MKKKTRSCLNRLLDTKFSAFVRQRGSCQRCDKTNNLQCAHIYSRRYANIRHHPLNALCLCSGCHFWAHQNPTDFSDFVRDLLGESYEELRELRNKIGKFTIQELEDKLKEIRASVP